MQEQVRQAVPFPLYVWLDGEPVVVVGAGEVAARKVDALLEYGARVKVVAPEGCDAMHAHEQAGHIVWERRPYHEGDLAGAVLSVVATNERAVNEAAYREARSCRSLVNVVDAPELCTCIVPSIMRRGQLQVAVSTNGAAPSVAREIRHGLEEEFPAWWGDYIDLMAEVRSLVKERVLGPTSVRTPLFEALGRAGLENCFALGEHPDPEDVYTRVVDPLLEGGGR